MSASLMTSSFPRDGHAWTWRGWSSPRDLVQRACALRQCRRRRLILWVSRRSPHSTASRRPRVVRVVAREPAPVAGDALTDIFHSTLSAIDWQRDASRRRLRQERLLGRKWQVAIGCSGGDWWAKEVTSGDVGGVPATCTAPARRRAPHSARPLPRRSERAHRGDQGAGPLRRHLSRRVQGADRGSLAAGSSANAAACGRCVVPAFASASTETLDRRGGSTATARAAPGWSGQGAPSSGGGSCIGCGTARRMRASRSSDGVLDTLDEEGGLLDSIRPACGSPVARGSSRLTARLPAPGRADEDQEPSSSIGPAHPPDLVHSPGLPQSREIPCGPTRHPPDRHVPVLRERIALLAPALIAARDRSWSTQPRPGWASRKRSSTRHPRRTSSGIDRDGGGSRWRSPGSARFGDQCCLGSGGVRRTA